MMGRVRRGGYIIEWWKGDHWPKHVHVYQGKRKVTKVQMPELRVLQGRLSKKLRRILEILIKEGVL